MKDWDRLNTLDDNEHLWPKKIRVKAIDVIPYRWSLWCTVGDCPDPFANEIVRRRWSEDGQHIWFMLESHNFLKAAPDDELELVPIRKGAYSEDFLARTAAEDAARIANRPTVVDNVGV